MHLNGRAQDEMQGQRDKIVDEGFNALWIGVCLACFGNEMCPQNQNLDPFFSYLVCILKFQGM